MCDETNVPSTVIRVYGKRSAERKAVLKKVSLIRASGTLVDEVSALDEVRRSNAGLWDRASEKVSKFLDQHCWEPSTLFLFPGALLRMTSNNADEQFSQGQLAVFSSANDDNTINVLLAPYGTNQLPPIDTLHSDYLTQGWRCLRLSQSDGFNHSFFGTPCHRKQYPVKNFVAMTIHKSMDGELPQLLTKISLLENDYALWE